MSAKKKHSNRPQQDNSTSAKSSPEVEPKAPASNPDAVLNAHLEAAMGIAKALHRAAAIHVINGRLAYFNSTAGEERVL
jgi:hypothetical protein